MPASINSVVEQSSICITGSSDEKKSSIAAHQLQNSVSTEVNSNFEKKLTDTLPQLNEKLDKAPSLTQVRSVSSVISFSSNSSSVEGENNDRQIPTDSDLESIHNGLTLNKPPRNKFRLISACIWQFAGGFSDGSLGAMIPYIEEYYNITYSIVSLIWLGNAIGFLCIAFTSQILYRKLGRRKMITYGIIFSIIMFIIICCSPPFPVMVVAFFIGGLGIATSYTQLNIFVSSFEESSKYLGYFHGSYGLGATLSPIAATTMCSKGVKWSYFYFILLALQIINLTFNFWSFKNCDDCIPFLRKKDSNETMETMAQEHEITTDEESLVVKNRKGELRQAVGSWKIWCICLFVFVYQGQEVGLGGWIDTFLIDYRDGKASAVGYVSSGFWGGLTFGRFVLTTPLSKLGLRRPIIVLIFGIIALELLTWLIPNIISAAVTASLVGVCVGPIYPLMISLVVRMIPSRIELVSLTMMTAFGSFGGALFPFLIGLISQFFGTFVVHPIVIALVSVMLVFWLWLPNIEHKKTNRSHNDLTDHSDNEVDIHRNWLIRLINRLW